MKILGEFNANKMLLVFGFETATGGGIIGMPIQANLNPTCLGLLIA